MSGGAADYAANGAVTTMLTSANTTSKVLGRVLKTSAASAVLLQHVPVRTISRNGQSRSGYELNTAGGSLHMLTHIRQLVQLFRHRFSGLLVSFNQQHLPKRADTTELPRTSQRFHHAYIAPAVHSGTQGARKNLGPVSSSRRPADEPVNSL